MAEKTEKPKRSWKKILLKTVTITLIVLAVVLVLLLWQLDRVAAVSVRTVGSQLTGTPVELDNVSINILNGVVKFNGFRVGNPAGFQNDSAVKVGNFHFDLGVTSLFGGDKVEIEHLELGGVALDYEYQFGGSNLDIIQRNVEKATGADQKAKEQKQSASQEQPQAQGEAKKQSAQKKVVIRKLILKDIRVTVSSKLTRTSFPLILPPIEMDNVGEKGENIAQVIDEVLTKIITCITQCVDISKLGGSLSEVGQATWDGVNKAAGGIGDVASKAADGISDAASKAGDAVKGLFK